MRKQFEIESDDERRVFYQAELGEYGLVDRKDFTSYSPIEYCPWCGKDIRSSRFAAMDGAWKNPLCQSITVQVQSEWGELVAGPVFWERPPLPGLDNARFTCLRFVDPCGDTVFNQGQISVFLDDLLRLLKLPLTDTQFSDIRNIEALIGPYVQTPHHYVKLIGD